MVPPFCERPDEGTPGVQTHTGPPAPDAAGGYRVGLVENLPTPGRAVGTTVEAGVG
jgi:hypothetical protein